MLAALTLGGYALVLLIALVVAVRWLYRHDPTLREDWSPIRDAATPYGFTTASTLDRDMP